MDTTGKLYVALAVISVISAMVAFWFISRNTPKGTLLAMGAVLWLVGKAVAGQPIREMRLLGGVCTLCGFMGVILGIFDLFRKEREKKPPNDTVHIDQDEAARPPHPPTTTSGGHTQ